MPPAADTTGDVDTPFLLHDGRSVTVRHIRPADAQLVVDLYARLSPEARRQRFFHSHRVGVEEGRRVASIEDHGGVALVTIAADGTMVADARCVRSSGAARPDDGSPVANFAITIRDDYQRAGLGKVLLDELVAAAASAGITTLVAEILGDNVGMRRLLSTRHFTIIDRDGFSMVQAVFTTDGRMPAWADDAPRPRVLIESRGWYGSMSEQHLRDAGYAVMVCPSAPEGGTCELIATGSCRLVDGADAIICSVCDDQDRQVLAAHQASSAHTPLFVMVGPDDPAPAEPAEALRRSATAEQLLDALDRHGVGGPVDLDR